MAAASIAEMQGHFAPVSPVAMFEKDYFLPCSKLHTAILDRNRQANRLHRGVDMRWHIVPPFGKWRSDRPCWCQSSAAWNHAADAQDSAAVRSLISCAAGRLDTLPLPIRLRWRWVRDPLDDRDQTIMRVQILHRIAWATFLARNRVVPGVFAGSKTEDRDNCTDCDNEFHKNILPLLRHRRPIRQGIRQLCRGIGTRIVWIAIDLAQS